MDLGRHILDKELLDRQGWRAGRADDLLLEIGEPARAGSIPAPEVVALISGPLALSRNLPRPLRWWARPLYRLLGVADPQPVEIPWSAVSTIDVVIHLNIERDEAGLTALRKAVERHYIGKLPGA